jgi:hypothetical protein
MPQVKLNEKVQQIPANTYGVEFLEKVSVLPRSPLPIALACVHAVMQFDLSV